MKVERMNGNYVSWRCGENLVDLLAASARTNDGFVSMQVYLGFQLIPEILVIGTAQVSAE